MPVPSWPSATPLQMITGLGDELKGLWVRVDADRSGHATIEEFVGFMREVAATVGGRLEALQALVAPLLLLEALRQFIGLDKTIRHELLHSSPLQGCA